MTIIQAKSENDLTLGRQGENLARQVVFDLSAWEAEYGPGVAELIHQRPGDTSPYPVAAVREGSTLVWTLTATDTAVASSYGSDGHCELRYYVGEVLVKSRTWLTKVIRAMSTPSETAPPEPEQGWVDQVVAVGAAAQASADAAKADADRAAALAAEVAEKAAQTAKDAVQSAQAKEAAQTAQRLAEEAQSAAEAAKTAVAAAQAAAEQSATDAAGAKQDAETALKSAQDAAAAAAKALADIRALYQEMQTWAQGVIQDVNAAGIAAVQSVQSAGDAQIQRVAEEGTRQTSNAKAQADAAALSASGAAQSAQKAAESAAVYDNVVADVTQLKQDVAAITPDDTAVDGKPWTSKKIVDSLCQPIEESGNPVQCYPVENYPLGVRVSWEPVQEGEGDPSPDNIRPITGRNAVSVTRCGKNLYDAESYPMKDGGWINANTGGTVTDVDYKYSPYIPITPNTMFTVNQRPGGNNIGIAFYDADKNFISGEKNNNASVNDPWTVTSPNKTAYMRFTVVAEHSAIMIELGSTATPYEPYTGSTTDIALPETVYGGELDLETGVLTVDTGCAVFTGEETFQLHVSGYHAAMQNAKITDGVTQYNTYCTCSHFKATSWALLGKETNQCSLYFGDSRICFNVTKEYASVDEFKAYLAAQYENGTPVTVTYALQTPYTIQLTEQQIAALSGVNTLYTDADSVVVTGAEDPKHTITELKNAIISLGGNV